MGGYILLSDQDDLWMPNHIEVLASVMSPNVILASGKPQFVTEYNEELPRSEDYFSMDYIPTSNEGHARHIFLGGSSYQGASMMMRREFIQVALPIPEYVEYHDNWFAACSCFAGGLRYVDIPIVRYRRWGNAVTSAKQRKSVFRTFIGALLFNHALKDRLYIIDAIEDRIVNLSDTQSNLLGRFRRMLLRRKTFTGRFMNLPYIISHFKEIYAFDGKHLLN